jgi:hypothetical protein
MEGSVMPHIARRLLLVVVVLAGLTALLAVLDSVRDTPRHLSARGGELHGVYSVIHADGGRFDDTYTPVVTHDGTLVTSTNLRIAPGSRVTLRNDALVSHSLSASTALGTRKLLIVPVVWGSRTIQGTQASDRSFGNGPLATWYKAASYGQFSWSASATPRVKITAPTGSSVGTWLGQVQSRANTKISALGYRPGNYSAVLYEVPVLIGGAAGYGMVPGRYAWVKTPLNIRVAAHELGHTLGLYHAHADECGNASMQGTSDATMAASCFSVNHECGASSGTVNASCWGEYGDPFAAMGESWMQMSGKAPNAGSFDAPEKAQLGWVSSANGREQTVTQSGDYPISGYEDSAHTAPQAVKITTPDGTLWFEYRTWTGIDTVFQNYFSAFVNGGGFTFPNSVLVHIDHPVNGGGDLGSLLIDTTASSTGVSQACSANGLASLPGFCDAGLLNGQRFIDFGHLVVEPMYDAGAGQEYLHVVFDSTGPNVSGMTTTPADGSTTANTSPTFQITSPATDDGSGVAYYAVYVDKDLNTNPAPDATLLADGTLSFSEGMSLGTHSYTVVAVDFAGNSTVGPTQTFTVS